MNTFPSPAAQEFQDFLAGWVAQVNGLTQEVETWAGNKEDSNQAFNYTTAKADLQTALTNFETSVQTVTAL